MNRENNAREDLKNFFKGMFVLCLLFLGLIQGIKFYVNHTVIEDREDTYPQNTNVITYPQYEDIKQEVLLMSHELEKQLSSGKIKKKEVIFAKEITKVDVGYCKMVDRHEKFNCYFDIKKRILELESFQTAGMFSSRINGETIKTIETVESSKIMPTDVEKSSNDKIYETIMDGYKEIFKTYTEQLSFCKNEEDRFNLKATQKIYDERVRKKQYQSLFSCYETLQIISDNFDTMSVDKNIKGSKEFNTQIKEMIDLHSKNKKTIEEKVTEFKIKMN
jgi:hypothetical protein